MGENKQRVVKGTHKAPEWFKKEYENFTQFLDSEMVVMNVPDSIRKGAIQAFAHPDDVSEGEVEMLLGDIMSHAQKNPVFNRFLEMMNLRTQYVWAKLRYREWNAYGYEHTLKYDYNNNSILVMGGIGGGGTFGIVMPGNPHAGHHHK